MRGRGEGEGRGMRGGGDIGWVVAFNLSEVVSAPASSGRIMAELLIMPYFLPLPLPLPLP